MNTAFLRFIALGIAFRMTSPSLGRESPPACVHQQFAGCRAKDARAKKSWRHAMV
jgi:hypothetical protein